MNKLVFILSFTFWLAQTVIRPFTRPVIHFSSRLNSRLFARSPSTMPASCTQPGSFTDSSIRSIFTLSQAPTHPFHPFFSPFALCVILNVAEVPRRWYIIRNSPVFSAVTCPPLRCLLLSTLLFHPPVHPTELPFSSTSSLSLYSFDSLFLENSIPEILSLCSSLPMQDFLAF